MPKIWPVDGVGESTWWGSRGLTASHRCLIVGLGVLLALIAGLEPAVADPGPQPANPAIDSSPSNVTTADSLVWTFSGTQGQASCELDEGSTVVSALTNCSSPASFDVSADSGGVYDFTVWAADAADVDPSSTPSATSQVDVAPTAPALTASPTTPGDDTSPSWSFVTPTGAAVTCELDFAGNPVVVKDPCSSPFSPDLSADSDGRYSLVLTATSNGVTSDSTTSTYDLETAAPTAPTVVPPPSPSRDTSPTFTISDPDQVTLTCQFVDPAGDTLADGKCPASGAFSTVGDGDGQYTLTVTATDSYGNTSQTSVNWTRDTTAPPAPVISAPATPSKDRTPAFTVTDGDPSATLLCRVDGPSVVSTTACGSTTVLDLTGAADGAYVLRVTAVDEAGNDSVTTSTTYTLITTAPPAPSILSPASPGNNRAPSFTVSDDESDVTYVCTATESGVAVKVKECSATTMLALTHEADGTISLTVAAVDALGNQGPATTVHYVLDTTAPTAPTVTAPSSPGSTTTPTFGVSEPDSNVTLTCDLTAPDGSTVFDGNCPTPATFDTGSEGDGSYSLTVTATDQAGNSSTATATWVRDTTPPPAPIVGTPSSPSNLTDPNLTITDTDPTAIFTCAATGPSGPISVTGCNSATPSLDLTGVPDGTITVTVFATDAAGNVGPTTTKSWQLLTAPPNAPTLSGSTTGNSRTFSVNATDTTPGVTYQCSVTGPGRASVSTCAAASVVKIGTSSPDGDYIVQVAAVDGAGNVSTAESFTYVLDTTAPPAPLITNPPASPTNVVTPVVQISDTESDVVFTCDLAGPGGTETSGGCPTTGDISTQGFDDGKFTLTVTATDPAGNTSSTVISWVRDTVAPAAPSVALAPSTPPRSNSTSAVFDVSPSDPGDTLNCTATDPHGVAVPVALGKGTCTIDLSGSTAQGTYTLKVVETDAAGNTSTGHGSYVFDTLPPALPSLSLVTSSPSRSLVPDWQITPGVDDATYECVLTENAPTQATLYDASCGTTFDNVNLTGNSGSFTLAVSAFDVAGNETSAVESTYILDRIKPAVPSISLRGEPEYPLSDGYLSDDTDPALSVAPQPDVTFTCSLIPVGGTAVAVPCGPTLDLSGYNRPGGVTTAFQLVVVATDEAGNTSRATTTYELRTVIPKRPQIDTGPIGPTPISRAEFSWLNPNGFGYQATCSIDNAAGQVVVGPVHDCRSPWVVRLPKGSYAFEVTESDKAGNVSPAATRSFSIDPSAPPPPIINAPRSPSRLTDPRWVITPPKQATSLTCELFEGSVTVFKGNCPANGRFNLAGRPDGVFLLSVYATLPSGESSNTARFTLDRQPPPRPQLISRPAPVSGRDDIAWHFLLPAGTRGFCTLSRDGRRIASGSCTDSAAYALANRAGDGAFVLTVIAVDEAGNQSRPLTVNYSLPSSTGSTNVAAVPTPQISVSAGNHGRAVWHISDAAANRFFCSLVHDGAVVTGEQACGSSFVTDLSGRTNGTYQLRVQAIGAGGALSSVAAADFNWTGGSPTSPYGGPKITPPPPATNKTGSSTGTQSHQVPPPVKHNPAPSPQPSPQASKNPTLPPGLGDGFTRHFASGVQTVFSNIGDAGGGAGFPLLLVLVVALFLIVQNRIDRRDPKLALAAVGADDMVEFALPPSQESTS